MHSIACEEILTDTEKGGFYWHDPWNVERSNVTGVHSKGQSLRPVEGSVIRTFLCVKRESGETQCCRRTLISFYKNIPTDVHMVGREGFTSIDLCIESSIRAYLEDC
jgi:hypothetical protein